MNETREKNLWFAVKTVQMLKCLHLKLIIAKPLGFGFSFGNHKYTIGNTEKAIKSLIFIHISRVVTPPRYHRIIYDIDLYR